MAGLSRRFDEKTMKSRHEMRLWYKCLGQPLPWHPIGAVGYCNLSDPALDPDFPSAVLVGGDVPVGDDGRRLVDALDATLATADRLDREAPDPGRLRPFHRDGNVQPFIG